MTPAQMDGLGTHDGLKNDESPIAGVAALEWETPNHREMPDLIHLAVRLPRELSPLTPVIIHQVEREVARSAK